LSCAFTARTGKARRPGRRDVEEGRGL